MTGRNLGDIGLKDYVSIVRKRSALRRGRALLVAASCIACFGAGYVSPRPGKDSLKLTLPEAMAIIEKAPDADWEHEQAVGVIQRCLRTSIEKLGQVAVKNDSQAGRAGAYARNALYYAARDAIEHLMALRSPGVEDQQLTRMIKKLQDLFPK